MVDDLTRPAGVVVSHPDRVEGRKNKCKMCQSSNRRLECEVHLNGIKSDSGQKVIDLGFQFFNARIPCMVRSKNVMFTSNIKNCESIITSQSIFFISL